MDPKVMSILKSVLDQCEKEKSQNYLDAPFEAVETRASYYTGYATHFFCNLQEQNKNLTPVILNINIRQKYLLLQTFKDIYTHAKSQGNFTYSQILSFIHNKADIFQTVNHHLIIKQLCAMGYEYKNTTMGPLIVENPKLRYERFLYLNKIIRFRNGGKPISYVEVRVIDDTLNFEKISSSTPTKNDISFFLYAISRNGYINGIFCNIMDRETFTKWITDILLPMLAPNSVLVIDSGELFNEEIKPITRYSAKTDMLKWLNANDVPYSCNMYKPELYELITKYGIKNHTYKIDHILKAYGHDVLRKPENFHDLSPTELFWNNIKTENYESFRTIKQTLEKHIEKIEKLKWELFSDATANWEKDILEVDSEIENVLDFFEFQTENINEAPTIPFS